MAVPRRPALAALVFGLSAAAAGGTIAIGGCYDFDFVEAGAEGGVDAPGDVVRDSSAACIVDRLYCGGDRTVGATDTVYRCLVDGGAVLVAKCASGCLREAGAGEPGRCAVPVTPCIVNGRYCGGDKLDGDPAVLYRCGTGGTAIEIERCAKGCQVAKQGTDDDCVR